jgi:hypothetical protein
VPAMPRYFFHLNDGKRTFTDSTGIELTGIVAARARARAQILEIKSTLPLYRVLDWAGWKMIVSDADGKIVAEINFSRKPTK